MFGLIWSAVDLDRGELFVRHQLVGKRLSEPKSDAGMHRIGRGAVPKGRLLCVSERGVFPCC